MSTEDLVRRSLDTAIAEIGAKREISHRVKNKLIVSESHEQRLSRRLPRGRSVPTLKQSVLAISSSRPGGSPAVNAVIERFLEKPYPARSYVEVSALPNEVATEVEAVAAIV